MFKKLLLLFSFCLIFATVFGVNCYQNKNGENITQIEGCNYCGYYYYFEKISNNTGELRCCLQEPYITYNESGGATYNYTHVNECDYIEVGNSTQGFAICNRMDLCNQNCETALITPQPQSTTTTGNCSIMIEFNFVSLLFWIISVLICSKYLNL